MTRHIFIRLGTSVLLAATSLAATRPKWELAPLNPEFIAYTNRLAQPAQPLAPETGQHRTGYIPPPFDTRHLRQLPRGLLNQLAGVDLPARYDLRDIPGKLPPVKNQNPFGTCWAFAFCASAESLLRPAVSTDFSEWHMAHSSGFDWGWNDGGDFLIALAYSAAWKGLADEQDCPYNTAYSASSPKLSFPQVPASWHVREAHLLSGDSATVKQALTRYGSVWISYVHNNSYARSAVYNGHATTTYCAPINSTGENHAVAIIGWDDAFPAAAFLNAPAGDGAWIVRNSWGTDWGDGGYFYLSYFDPTLTVRGCLADMRPVEKSTDLLWSYTPLGICSSYGNGTDTIRGANIFTSSTAHRLESVGFYLAAHNVSYEISVYTGCTANNPVSGTCHYGPQGEKGGSISGTRTYAGYYTVDLPEDITVSAGQRFSVVIRFTTPNFVYLLAVERAVSGYSTNATAAPGQSFVSDNGIEWEDLTRLDPTANICIDAFSHYSSLQSPSAVTASYDTYTDRIRVSWAGTVKAEKYAIYRINGTSGTFANAERIGTALDSPYDDYAAIAGTTYTYWATALRDNAESLPATPATGRRETVFSSSLVTALNTSGLTWTTGGNNIWYGQWAMSYTDGCSARSGAISHNQVSWMETTITGPGILYFHWKVSSELGSWTWLYNYDQLRFFVNDVEKAKIAGEKGWEQKTYSIPAGTHFIGWAYTKDESTSKGSDCGWVDNIVWIPDQGVPDLTVRAITVDTTTWTAGEHVSVALTGRNQGNGSARAHNARLYLSTDATISQDDTPLGTPLRFKRLEPSFEGSQQISFLAPDKPKGTYYLCARLDTENIINESNKVNNYSSRGDIRYDPLVDLPADRGAIPLAEIKTYTDWITSKSTWQTDYASLPMSDFLHAYLLDEQPRHAITDTTGFSINSIQIGPTEISVDVRLDIASTPKNGPINGCVVIEGCDSLSTSWEAFASTPLGAGTITFVNGQASLIFSRPANHTFFRARIQRDPPSSATSPLAVRPQ